MVLAVQRRQFSCMIHRSKSLSRTTTQARTVSLMMHTLEQTLSVFSVNAALSTADVMGYPSRDMLYM
jgi:hypothetical protein